MQKSGLRNARLCDDLLFMLEMASKDARKRARPDESSPVVSDASDEDEPEVEVTELAPSSLTPLQTRQVALLANLSRRLISEGRVAERLAEAFARVGKPLEAAAVQARLVALRAAQGKSLMTAREGEGEQVQQKQKQQQQEQKQKQQQQQNAESMRRVFGSDPAIVRPFLTAERLDELANPFVTVNRLLRPGDVLHVPVTAEESAVLLRHLKNAQGGSFSARLVEACREMPGRTPADLQRFMDRVEDFSARHYSDVRLLRKVVVFEERAFVRTAEAEHTKSLHALLTQRALGSSQSGVFSARCAAQLAGGVAVREASAVSHTVRTIGSPTDVKFSPAGSPRRWLAVGSSPSGPYELMLFDLDSRRGEPDLTRLYGHHNEVVTEVQWSATGQYLATSGFDSFVRVWDPETGKMRNSLCHKNTVHGLVMSRRFETMVASRSFNTTGEATELRVWNLETDASIDLGYKYPFLGHVEQISFFGRGDEMLVAVTDGSRASSFGEAVVWDWHGASWQDGGAVVAKVRPHTGVITCVDVDKQSGSVFCTAGDDYRVAMVDTRVEGGMGVTYMTMPKSSSAGQQRTPEVQSLTFSPCSTMIAAASIRNDIVIFDVRGPPRSMCVLNHKYTETGFADVPMMEEVQLQGAYRASWMSYGRVLVSGGEDGCVRVWDMSMDSSECNIKTVRAHSRCISALDVSPCGSAVASGADDLKVGLFTQTHSSMHLGMVARRGEPVPRGE